LKSTGPQKVVSRWTLPGAGIHGKLDTAPIDERSDPSVSARRLLRRSPRERSIPGNPEAIDHIASAGRVGPLEPADHSFHYPIKSDIPHVLVVTTGIARHSFEQSQRHAFDERGKHKEYPSAA